MVLNTRHTGFVVLDLERFIKFYEGFGFTLVSRMIETGEYIDNLVGLKSVKLEWAKLSLPDGSLIELLQYQTHKDLIQKTVECGSPTPFFNPKHGYYTISFTPCEFGDRIYIHHHLTGVSKKIFDICNDSQELMKHNQQELEGSIEFLDADLDE